MLSNSSQTVTPPSAPRVLVVASLDKYHRDFAQASAPFFEKLAHENTITVDFSNDNAAINEENLARCKAFVLVNVAPFDLMPDQQAALQTYVENGGGFVGVHAVGLTGCMFRPEGTPYWQWFEDLLGGVRYSPHPAYQTGEAVVEDASHAITQNVPARFSLADEWYEFDKSPRPAPGIRVLATADEATYKQNAPMGDHPIVWVNETYRRAAYMSLGHDALAFQSPAYTTLLQNAVLWAAS